MKTILCTTMLAIWAASAVAADTAVTVSVGQPGFYGQISIGNFPPPQLVYAQPVVVHPVPVVVAPAPIYLHVPPGHEKHWSKHCAAYNACGRPVYFVRDDWYNKVYVPHYQQRGGDEDEGHGHHGHGHDKGDDDDQGHGHHDH
jgi:hypothetical protein